MTETKHIVWSNIDLDLDDWYDDLHEQYPALGEEGLRDIQKRSTNPTSDYKGNVTGSDIAYAFHHTGTSDRLFVFEAPIDMLSYISMHKNHWEHHSYVALCSTADCAAIRMLKR